MNYFVTAIGTDSGKTLASAILTEALQADYWKPIQAGLPRDTDTVKSLVKNNKVVFHPEAYLLNTPASPHYAAEVDQVEISTDNILAPTVNKDLVIEGAGGALVPINDTEYVIDLVAACNAQVILVSDLYLGSINHTLLTIEALSVRKIHVKGIIFNGKENKASREIILRKSGYRQLLHIKKETEINISVVKKYADLLIDTWNES